MATYLVDYEMSMRTTYDVVISSSGLATKEILLPKASNCLTIALVCKREALVKFLIDYLTSRLWMHERILGNKNNNSYLWASQCTYDHAFKVLNAKIFTEREMPLKVCKSVLFNACLNKQFKPFQIMFDLSQKSDLQVSICAMCLYVFEGKNILDIVDKQWDKFEFIYCFVKQAYQFALGKQQKAFLVKRLYKQVFNFNFDKSFGAAFKLLADAQPEIKQSMELPFDRPPLR